MLTTESFGVRIVALRPQVGRVELSGDRYESLYVYAF